MITERALRVATDGERVPSESAQVEAVVDVIGLLEKGGTVLRSMVFDLALRGSLGTATAEEEPVDSILQQVGIRPVPEGRKDVPCALPRNWRWVRLGDLVEYNLGARVDGPRIPDQAWLLELEDIEPRTSRLLCRVTAGARHPRSSKTQFQAGDVLYGKLRPYLDKVVVATEPGYCTTEIVPIRGRGATTSEYLWIALKGSDFRAFATTSVHGMSMPRLGAKSAAEALIPVPPVSEQKRIVAKVALLLELCDALESKRHRWAESKDLLANAAVDAFLMAENSRELAAAWTVIENCGSELFDSVDHLALLRRIILEAATRGMLVPPATEGPWPSDILRLARDKLRSIARRRVDDGESSEVDPSEHPPLPPGWLAVRFAQLGYCQNGRAFPSGDYCDDGVRLLRPGNLHVSGEVRWTKENLRCLPVRYRDEFPEFIVRGGELIMNLTAQSLKDEFLGRVCITGPDEYCLLNQRQARVTAFGMNPRFLLWLFRAPYFRRYVDGLNQGALIQHMFTKQVDRSVVLVPPRPEQDAIVQRLDGMMMKLDRLEQLIAARNNAASKLGTALAGNPLQDS